MLEVSDERLLALCGLDAYVLVRYIKLCLKCCFTSTVLCGCLLVPIYVNFGGKTDASLENCEERFVPGVNGTQVKVPADDDVVIKECRKQDFFRYTMQNLFQDGIDSADHEFYWVASVVVAYLLSAHACYLVRSEYRNFRDHRLAFFVRGDPAIARQSLYTVMVENVPPQYRLNVEFRHLFDALFPGKVVASEVMSPLASLRAAVDHAEDCAEALENAAAARRQDPAREPTVLVGPWCEGEPWDPPRGVTGGVRGGHRLLVIASWGSNPPSSPGSTPPCR